MGSQSGNIKCASCTAPGECPGVCAQLLGKLPAVQTLTSVARILLGKVDFTLRLLENDFFKELFPLTHLSCVTTAPDLPALSGNPASFRKHPLSQHRLVALGLHSELCLRRTETSRRVLR